MEGDAEDLKFEDNSLDGYTIAFGIRNVTHIEKVLAEAYRYAYTLAWLLTMTACNIWYGYTIMFRHVKLVYSLI